jgi:hypothetical protein
VAERKPLTLVDNRPGELPASDNLPYTVLPQAWTHPALGAPLGSMLVYAAIARGASPPDTFGFWATETNESSTDALVTITGVGYLGFDLVNSDRARDNLGLGAVATLDVEDLISTDSPNALSVGSDGGLVATGGAGGQVGEVQAGDHVNVDSTDPTKPIVSVPISGTPQPGDVVGYDGSGLAYRSGGINVITMIRDLTAVDGDVDGSTHDIFRAPLDFRLDSIKASLGTASSSGDVEIEVFRDGNTIFGSNKLIIEEGETTSKVSSDQPIIVLNQFADDALIETEMVSAGSGAKGLRVYFIGRSNVVEYVLWTPLYLSVAPKIWLDHTATVIESSGFASLWTNLGTIGDDFSQSVAGSRPGIIANGLNGHRILRFDGINDRLEGTSSGLRSVFSSVSYGWLFAVVRRQAVSSKIACILQSRTATGTGRFACYSGSNVVGYYNSASLVARRGDGDAAGVIRSPDDYSTSWAMIRFAQNWGIGDGVIYTDGAYSVGGTTTSAGVTASSLSDPAVYIGSEGNASYSDNEIACIIASSGAIPTTDEYQRLEGYYAHEYALQSNLPADHPFKLYPPYVTTPKLQTNLGSAPAVIGFHAGTDSGQVGLAIGDAVASEFGVLLNSLPALSVGAGITVASAGGDITVRLDDITPVVTPALATIYDYRGETLASVTLSAGSGYYTGTVSGSLVDGSTYYVQLA